MFVYAAWQAADRLEIGPRGDSSSLPITPFFVDNPVSCGWSCFRMARDTELKLSTQLWETPARLLRGSHAVI